MHPSSEHKPVIRMLYLLRERFPTHRVDVAALFGNEMLARGHEIDFVMQADSVGQATGRVAWRGGAVFVGRTDAGSGTWHRLRRIGLAFLHDLQSLRNIEAGHYDAVQVRDKFLVGAVALFMARRKGLRFFFWLSFPEPESELLRARSGSARYKLVSLLRGHIFGWLLYRVILPRCDHAFVQSEQMRRDVSSEGIPPAKLTAVPMGISAADIPQARSAPSRVAGETGSGRPLVLAYLGTMVAERRLEVLVDMLALVRRRGVDARLVFIGDGQDPGDRLRIEGRAIELDVRSCVEITGFLPRDRAMARLSDADIAISPFYPTPVLRSTSPTKLVEYMASGLPVVANDHPEQRLILRESKAGIRVPWDARHFARAVVSLARMSEAQRLAMGERGRKWVLMNRTYDKIADELERRYLELLAKRSPVRRTIGSGEKSGPGPS
jgi:glycosyltransferase involved in cell wall biosynthesis